MSEQEKQQSQEPSVNEQILRTLKHTNEANASIVNMVQKQTNQNKLKLLFWILPIIFVMGFYIKQHYDQSNFYDKEKGYV